MSKNAVMPLSDYVDICDTIRGHLKINDKLTSDAIPPMINEVFRQGGNEAYAPAYDKGYADKSAEYNQLARDFSIIVYGKQKNEAIENVVNTAITDIGDAKVAIESRGVPVPSGMPTSELHTKIMAVYDLGADIGFSAGKAQGRTDYAEELIEYNHNLQQAVYGIPSGRPIEEVTEQAASDLNAIKEKIKEKGVEIPSLTPSSEYPAKIEDVYGKGYAQGESEGFEAGKKSQYDEYWDGYQSNGKRTNYNYAFAGEGWNDTTFKPKYPLRGMTYANSIFLGAFNLTEIPYVIDLTSLAGNITGLFQNMNSVRNIKEVIVKESIGFVTCFNNDSNLEEVRFSGTIGKSGLNLQWSTKLSKASWVSIVGCYSTTISGLSMTGSLASVNSAFETSEGANDGSTSAEWLNLIATRPNVSFNLV